MKWKVDILQSGKNLITSERGNSMLPLLKSGQKHELEPVRSWEDINIGDIVFCRVRGNNMTHLVTSKNNEKGLQISNNHGHVNGWTKIVYGKLINKF